MRSRETKKQNGIRSRGKGYIYSNLGGETLANNNRMTCATMNKR
jgi:hypothetical protein